MPQCKRNGCREQAQKYGKRLCPKHEAERAARAAREFAKPRCTYCHTQHTARTDAAGNAMCPTCFNEQLRLSQRTPFEVFMDLPENERWEQVWELLQGAGNAAR